MPGGAVFDRPRLPGDKNLTPAKLAEVRLFRCQGAGSARLFPKAAPPVAMVDPMGRPEEETSAARRLLLVW